MESPVNRAALRVGLLYDERMCKHSTAVGAPHPENPERIRAIWNKLESEGITQRCVLLDAKQADDKHLASVHTKTHIDLIKSISSKKFAQRQKIASKLNSIYFNEGSSEAAYLAAGSVIEATDRVARGDVNSAVAIVRPPGHHAESDQAMGFCLFNNVAVAANVLLNERPELDIKKILIVDWDVHHGNGTQNAFYKDPRVLYFSVHRFDFGSFYPAGGDGAYFMIGEDLGAGYNINVPWEHGECGDADYIAVWDHLLIPVVEAYNPDIILISAGFDAAMGDPLGGCCISPFGYSLMLNKLMRFAEGKIVMALEGGYNLNSMSVSVLACMKTLLDEKHIDGSVGSRPFESTWHVIQEVRNVLKPFWPILCVELRQDILINNSQLFPVKVNGIYISDSDVEHDEAEVDNVDGVILPLTELTINNDSHEKPSIQSDLRTEQSSVISSERGPPSLRPDQVNNFCVPWRSTLSKIEVWYASFGSNMWKDRFLCYIEGGKVDGMNTYCNGSRDKSFPTDVVWKIVPHKLFFARSHNSTWGAGGVSFLHPESNSSDRAYMCLYKITLEQFNDVLLLENRTIQQLDSPLLDASQLDLLSETKTMVLEGLKGGWYSNVLYLGIEDGIPILTMTCPFSDIEQYKSGGLPLCAPSKEYVNTLVKGLVLGKQLTEEEAIEYIKNATITKL